MVRLGFQVVDVGDLHRIDNPVSGPVNDLEEILPVALRDELRGVGFHHAPIGQRDALDTAGRIGRATIRSQYDRTSSDRPDRSEPKAKMVGPENS